MSIARKLNRPGNFRAVKAVIEQGQASLKLNRVQGTHFGVFGTLHPGRGMDGPSNHNHAACFLGDPRLKQLHLLRVEQAPVGIETYDAVIGVELFFGVREIVEDFVGVLRDARQRRLQQNVPRQGQATGAQFGRRVGHGEAAANRAPMAHTGMGNMLDRLMQQGEFPADQGTGGQFAMAYQSADLDISVAFGDLAQPFQTADIYQVFGCGESKVQQRQQALAAGDNGPVLAMAGQHRKGLGQCLGPQIFKVRRLHRAGLFRRNPAGRRDRAIVFPADQIENEEELRHANQYGEADAQFEYFAVVKML